MSKERLEEIIDGMPYSIRYSGELEPIIGYAKEQVERVQELEELRQILTRDKSMLIEELVREQQQNKRYREALEFYAEQDNYEWETNYRPQQEIDCMVIDDGGHTARKALEGEE